MQGTQVRSLVREDSTWHGASGPLCCNDKAHALEPVRSEAHTLQLQSNPLLATTAESLCAVTKIHFLKKYIFKK